MAQQPPVCQALLIIHTSRSHSDTPHSVGTLWTSDQTDNNQHSQQTDIHAPQWTPNLQIHALDREANGMGTYLADIIILGTRS